MNNNIKWWINFHEKLDKAVADFIQEKGERPSDSSLMEFMEFSYEKTRSET